MLKKTITYRNFDGDQVTDDFYFNLTSPELTRLTIKYGGDLSEYTNKLKEEKNDDGMINFIEELILGSYGEKSKDGKKFMKSKDIRDDFEYSAAYAELFEELLLKPSAADEFGRGLIHGAKKQQNSEAADLVAKREGRKNLTVEE